MDPTINPVKPIMAWWRATIEKRRWKQPSTEVTWLSFVPHARLYPKLAHITNPFPAILI